jgi:flavin reductase (DIM6/NTAB) family NADH-FMN oxidoreductase RutF
MSYMEFFPSEMAGKSAYFLMTSLVVPRPIAWVSTLAADGTRNLAPHSYFNAVSSEPLIIHFTSTGVKDSLTNVRATGEFVVNVVSRDLAEPMNLTAADFPPEEDEFTWAKLDATPSKLVAPPRVAKARAAFECEVNRIIELGNGNMVFGDVLCIHVAEEVLRDGRVDPAALDPIGRLGGSSYTAAAGQMFDLKRPSWTELR